MTTAHRPTFNPAQGGTGKNEGDLSRLSKQYSSRDMPSHTKLKYRQTGQASAEELKSKDFRRELEEREKTVTKDKRGRESASSAAVSASSSSTSKRPRLEQLASSANLDADDPVDDDEEQDDDEEEDDTAELMAELSRIKKEREAERAKIEAEKKAQEEQIRMDSILHGNPLLAGTAKQEFQVKRRWDDDVVFKNCAKGQDKKKEQTFINDALRSEFHKKFMDKYVK